MKGKAGFLTGSILLFALLPMWAFVLNEIKHERALTESAARNDAMNLATAFEAHVHSVIRLMDIMLLDMREDVLEHSDVHSYVRRELEAYGSFVAQFAAINHEGRLMYSTIAPEADSVDLSDREHFRIHRDNPDVDRLFISKPVLGRVSQQWTIQFTRPIRKDGRFAGVLVHSVPTRFFSDYYKQINVGPNGSIVLLGTDRSVRAMASGSPRAERYGQFEVPESKVYFDSNSPERGYFEGLSSLDGEYHLGAYRRLNEYGVVVVVLLAPKDFLADHHERRELLIVSAGVISVLLFAVGILIFVLSRRYFQSTANLRQAHDQLSRFANTDALTGVGSRRSFLHSLEAELARSDRQGDCLSLLMLDIDHFKRVNDCYGHPIGDVVLKQFTALCTRMLRSRDLFGRLGGEEFAIALPHTDAEGARCVAEKIRLAVAQTPIMTPAGTISITVSMGLACTQMGCVDVDQLIAKADGALYAAKHEGRNQVRVAGELQGQF